MLFPRPAPAPRLRIACLGPSARPLPPCSPATVGRFGRRNVATALRSLPFGRHRVPGPLLATRPRRPQFELLRGAQVAQVRGKRTRTVVKLDDLPQGLVIAPPSDPPPPEEPEEHEEAAYPTVVLQARRNMQKFDNCVLLTRVGGFYELYFDHAEEYGPLLNIKVAQKKTSAGPVPMVLSCARTVPLSGCSPVF